MDASIFHAFHHPWISEIARPLNRGLLPGDYYALAERHPPAFDPVLVSEEEDDEAGDSGASESSTGGGVLLARPKWEPTAETDMAFYRRKQSNVTVRHVGGDRIVAMVEVVSPGNKASRNPLRSFVDKAAQLLERGVHLLILDLFPPGRRDPRGIHAAIWEEIAGQEYTPPADKPLTLATYESGLTIRAYVAHAAVGDTLPDRPLFLEPEKAVEVPLGPTYDAAFAALPRRWRRVLE